ncbi:MAG: hypothetical protein JF586_11195 [Burkholderiales bacterium]|jgi:hypothetical protein|nr:hypothetical protein [Burkholderiales bacterium]
MDDRTTRPLTRRHALRHTAALGVGAAVAWLAATPVAAQAKLAKDAVKYVDKGDVPGKDCDDCRHYLAPAKADGPASCRLVEGAISPHGHCAAFTPRA